MSNGTMEGLEAKNGPNGERMEAHNKCDACNMAVAGHTCQASRRRTWHAAASHVLLPARTQLL